MKALKWVRILVAAGVFTLVTLFFLGLGGGCGLLEKFQLGPALVGCALVPLAAWLVVTLVFGRVYCSMVCPMGILQDLLGWVLHRRKFAPAPDRPWVRLVAVLVFALLTIAGGAALAGLVDPYSLFGRFASELGQPVAERANNLLADWLGTKGPVVIFKREVVARGGCGFVVAASALVLLAGLVAWKGRIVCNTICPMGAILAAGSRKTVFKLAFDPEKCVKCGICSGVCKAGCLDGKNQRVDNARCVRCFNCVAACAKGALAFTTGRGGLIESALPEAGEGTKVTRREMAAAMAASGVAGLAAVGLAGSGKCVIDRRDWPAGVLPPPGADLEKFRRRCTGCGLCVAACPQKVLTTAGFREYGVLGFMMPKQDFTHGYCDPNCTKCGEVCPTGAIRPFDVQAKAEMKLGHARCDREKCLACTEKISCGLCERRCPQKAITLKEEEVKDGDRTKKIKVPVVDGKKCTGCGKCENYCPVTAIRVVRRGRHGARKESKVEV